MPEITRAIRGVLDSGSGVGLFLESIACIFFLFELESEDVREITDTHEN